VKLVVEEREVVDVARRPAKKIVTLVLQFKFGFCKYCARD